jgi:hypothetical protein
VPTYLGLTNDDRTKEMVCVEYPLGLDAIKEKVVELAGERDVALQLVHVAFEEMKRVSVGTSTCTIKLVL